LLAEDNYFRNCSTLVPDETLDAWDRLSEDTTPLEMADLPKVLHRAVTQNLKALEQNIAADPVLLENPPSSINSLNNADDPRYFYKNIRRRRNKISENSAEFCIFVTVSDF